MKTVRFISSRDLALGDWKFRGMLMQATPSALEACQILQIGLLEKTPCMLRD